MDSKSSHRTDAEDGTEHVGTGTKVLLRTKVLKRLTLLLHWILRAGWSLNYNGLRLQLNRLWAIRGKLKDALNNQSSANATRSNLLVIAKVLTIHNNL